MNSLNNNDSPTIVLVGHSYGGCVITNAVRDNENVKALVYAAGFAPDEGENANQLATRFPGSSLGESLRAVPLASTSRWTSSAKGVTLTVLACARFEVRLKLTKFLF